MSGGHTVGAQPMSEAGVEHDLLSLWVVIAIQTEPDWGLVILHQDYDHCFDVDDVVAKPGNWIDRRERRCLHHRFGSGPTNCGHSLAECQRDCSLQSDFGYLDLRLNGYSILEYWPKCALATVVAGRGQTGPSGHWEPLKASSTTQIHGVGLKTDPGLWFADCNPHSCDCWGKSCNPVGLDWFGEKMMGMWD